MVRTVTDDDIGLKVLREAPTEAAETIDIVAIHGIGAHPDDSWCKNVGTTETPRWVNWLDAEDMLPAVAPHARIMRYGYQSQWFGEGAMRQDVSTVADRLLRALRRKRKEHPFRPLIFVAHCFGGLVVLKALLDAQHDPDEFPGTFISTTGLIFFGTPFRGAEGMSQVEMLAAARREYQEDEVQTDILKILEPGNEFLQDLVDQFGKMRRQTHKAEVACFYELKSSNVGRIVGKADRTRFVVNRGSGCLDLSDATRKYSLSRTHFDMNKFGKPTEEDFEMVGDVVEHMIRASTGLMQARSQPSNPVSDANLVTYSNSHPHNQNSKPTNRHRNFRLQGIPSQYRSRADVRELVMALLSIGAGTSVTIHSLATNPIDNSSKVSTLSFHDIPSCLSDKSRNEWQFILPADRSLTEPEFSSKRTLVFDTHFFGFTPLQHNNEDECYVDVVALAGLAGHAFGSFQERDGTFMWLRDALPLGFPSARILIYGYDTRSIRNDISQSLNDLGRAFRCDLRVIQQRHQSRPTVFLGHSLGGLVIKEAILDLAKGKDEIDAVVLDSASVFLFLGVPHQGMTIESLVPLIPKSPSRNFLEPLGKNSALLQRLEEEFNNSFGGRRPHIISFYETEKSSTAVEREDGTWDLSGPLDILVDASAICDSRHQYPINRNHFEMVKCSHQHDELYKRVMGALKDLVSKQNNAVAEITEDRYNQSLQPSSESIECLQSISFPEQEHRYYDIHSAKDTCEWLLENQQYQAWLGRPRGLFWVKGNPGAGKSVLMKFAVSMMNLRKSGELVISFFITGRGTLLQRTPVGLFRALLSSLLRSFPEYLEQFTATFVDREKRHGSYREKRWDWSEGELEKRLAEILTKGTINRPVVVFVDALDECGAGFAKGVLKLFKDWMKDAESQEAKLKICFSSRHYPILGLNVIPTISVEERNDKDIRSVIHEQLKEIQPKSKSQKIENDILLKAQGGFQWAVLVTSKVIEGHAVGTKAEKLQDMLSSIPEALDELYGNILSSIPQVGKYQMIKLFQWVLFAERPLSAHELRDALATDKAMECTTYSELKNHESWNDNPDEFERHVKHISGGLVEFRTRDFWERYELSGEDSNREAQFVHQSVADYILDVFPSVLEHSQHKSYSHVAEGHFTISRSCLKYIQLREVLERVGLPRSALSKRFPLLPYAMRFLFYHIQKVEQGNLPQSDLLELVQWGSRSGQISKIANLWKVFDPNDGHTPKGWPFTDATKLHALVGLGSRSAVDSFLGGDSVEVNGKDSEGNTPLLCAIKANHQDIALTLLLSRLDVQVDSRDLDGRTSLSWAAELGHKEVVKVLLQTGQVDADEKDVEYEQTPLAWAAEYGHKEIIELLIETKNVDVNAKDSEGRTPLSLAAKNGHEAVAKLLLETGNVEIDTKDVSGGTPLSWAAENGHRGVVKMLLNTGKVEANAKDDEYNQTPLAWAAQNGHEPIIRLLLEIDEVDIDTKDSNEQTPLSSAAENGHEAVVKLLLDTGKVDAGTKDVNGLAPLSWAALNGHEAVVKLLLSTGEVEADMKDSNEQTPLSLAAENGHEAVVKLLLSIGEVEADSKDSSEQTPLSWAAQNGHEAVVKLLLDTGKVKADLKDLSERTPLSWAAQNGHEAVVKLLLNTGKVEVDVKDLNGWTPLSLAAGSGHKSVVKLLLNIGKADAGGKDMNGLAPLSWAAKNGHEAVVKLLLDTGKVEADSKDLNKRTLLSWAAQNGHEAVVKLLLNIGKVEADLKDLNKRTPLSWAAQNGHEAVVKLLLDTGKVKADSKDSRERTPLSRAAQNGHEAVVKLLLDTGKVKAGSKDSSERTPLSRAAEYGHESVVKLLLSTGKVEADSKESFGWTPLSLAATNGHEAVVKLLLDTGKVEADLKDSSERTPLSQAAENGHEAVVKLLLGTCKVEADSKDFDKQTPLSWAAENGHEAVVKLLLDTGKVEADFKDKVEWTPLSRAAENGHEAVVKLLLDTGKVEADLKDSVGWTPLSRAAENGHEAVVKLLLDTGKVEADSKDLVGWTPLSWAAQNGHEAVVKLLLDTGKVKADSKDSRERTPLSRAAENGHEAVVKLLLDTCKVEADSKDSSERTPLSWAAENGHESVVKLLLNTGKVKADSKDSSERTPLLWAAQNGHEAVVKLLLDTGEVDPDARNIYNVTPLFHAVCYRHCTLVQILLDSGQVDVNVSDSNGSSLLSWAAENGDEEVVRLLLAAPDIQMDAKDTNGLTPLFFAARNGHQAIVRLLLNTGKVNVKAKSSNGWTPLSWMIHQGYRMLINPQPT